jgi:O-antigen/teichoic acid export membrane protein
VNSPSHSIPQDAEARDSASSHEAMGAVRNGLQLGGSLLVTYVIAMGVRFLLPKQMGVERFGSFNWADSFSAVFFVATHLGLEMYIRKEVTRRPEHASDFFGATLLIRMGLTAVLMGALAFVMSHDSHSLEVRQLVYVSAVAQSLIMLNASMAALLHAKGKVAGLSISNVVTKLVWGVGLFLAVVLKASLPWFAVSLVASEAVKLGVGWYLAKQHMGLTFKVDLPATWKVLRKSLPFFITGAALATNGRLDVMILGLKASHEEVGYYGAAWNIAGLTFFLNPVFSWVLMPLASRAAERSEAELTRLIRRALEGTLVITVPLMMLIVLGAPLWVGLLGGKFGPSVMALRLMSPLFVLAFVTMNAGMWLTMTNREWWVTITNVTGSLLIIPALNLVLIPVMHSALGAGGGAAGTALAILLMEVLVTISLMGRMKSAAFDARLLAMIGKTAAVCIAIAGLDQTVFAPLNPWVRLGIEAVLYVVGVLATGAVRPADVMEVVRVARRRGNPAPEAEAVPAVSISPAP